MKFAKGSFRNIYAIRFEPGEDVLLGLQKFCEDHGVGHGASFPASAAWKAAASLTPMSCLASPAFMATVRPLSCPAPLS